MNLSRIVALGLVIAAASACGSDEITNPSLPALAGVRFINGLSDSSAVDVRMVDQVEFSFNGIQNKAFRTGTEHQPVEAKARHIRVFPNSVNPAITSAFMVDTTITFAANSRYTLLLVRETPTHVHLVVIDDNVPAPPSGQISIRMVNTTTGAIDSYVVNTFAPTDPVAPPATIANVAPLGISTAISRAAGNAAVRVTPAGSTTVAASQAGPTNTTPTGENPAAAVNSPGTAFSVYYFPRSVPGTSAPQTTAAPNNYTIPGVVWFVDRNPAD